MNKKTSNLKVFLITFLVAIVPLLLGLFFLKDFSWNSSSQVVPVNKGAGKMINIPLNSMIELDFKTKREIYELRKKYTQFFPNFIKADYQPSEVVFGQIEDGKPWWGMLGLSYYGDGKNSIDGYSEESRFLVNPLLLVGLDSGYSLVVNNRNIQPAETYPIPMSLSWSDDNKKAIVRYDITSYKQRAAMRGDPNLSKNILTMIAYNAKDLGFDYLYVAPTESMNVVGWTNLVIIRQFIKTGGSCGYQGGCNNMSPYQPELEIRVDKLPARAYVKLWRDQPSDTSLPADMVYLIEMM